MFNGLGLRAVPTVILEGRTVHTRSRSVGCLSHFIEQELEAKGVTMEPEASAEAADTATPAEAPVEAASDE